MTEVSAEKKRSWFVVEFEVDKRQEEMVGWLMMQQGANGVQFISQLGESVTLQATFELNVLDNTGLGSLNAALDEYGLGEVVASLRSNIIEEEDWLLEWKKGFTPIELGTKFMVCPPWLEKDLSQEQRRSRHIIYIEPGLAFGTGFHATTQFCLKALERFAFEGRPASGRIIDVGSGSGILAIAAALLLPEAEVVAVEIDPLACRVAKENLVLNNVEKRVRLIEGDTTKLDGTKYDIILSNLTCEDNIDLLGLYKDILAIDGFLIMAGILREKLDRLEPGLKKWEFRPVEEELTDMWAGLVVRV